MIFNNAFEELNHDNNENQQTEVHNDDVDIAVYVKASRNFAKPVSYKDITEAMQKAVQSTEDTKRQYREVLHNETILKYCANVFHCLRAWGLRSKLGV